MEPEGYWVTVGASYAVMMTCTYLSRRSISAKNEVIRLAEHIKNHVRRVFPLDVGDYVGLVMLNDFRALSLPARVALQACIDVEVMGKDSGTFGKVSRRGAPNTTHVLYPVGLVVKVEDSEHTELVWFGLEIACCLTGCYYRFLGIITGWNIDGTKVTLDDLPSSPRTPLYLVTYRSTAAARADPSVSSWEPQNLVKPYRTPKQEDE